jgi:UDP-glucose 4-epimerase
MSKYVFVVGGNGYIGSHTNLELLEEGFQTVVLDKVFPKHLQNLPGWIWEKCDLLDPDSLQKVFEKYPAQGIVHFAANIEVGESQENPEKYYFNNVVGTLNLLQKVREFGVNNFVFSSTAAVYGLPKKVPISEEDPKNPINTYGLTKWMMEQILQDYYRSYNLKNIRLRYFNACGADLKGRTGELHEPESHLIPIILEVASGKREKLMIFGDDYNTQDGTCIRDYIHVKDLAKAHVLALKALLEGKIQQESINLGTKNGVSVREILETTEQIVGHTIKHQIAPRRAGDPDILIAENTKAERLLSWKPEFSDLQTIISSAWEFMQKN